MKLFSWAIVQIFILVFLQFLISNIKLLGKPPSGDFAYFYNTGQRVLIGQNPYIREGEPFLRNPPPALLIYSLLPLVPIKISQITFFAISFMAFFIGSYFLFNAIGYRPGWTHWLIYFIAVLIFFPFRYTLGSGHINNLLFLFIVLTFYFLKRKNEIASGFFLATAILLSVTPLFLAVILFLQKKFKILLWTILSLITVSFVTLLRFGFEIFKNYLSASTSYLDFGISAYYNQSLAALFTRIFNDPGLTQSIIFIILICSLLYFFYLIFKTKDNTDQGIIIWNIGVIYLIIFAPFAWQYHFVITIFPLLTTSYLILKTKQGFIFLFIVALSYSLIGYNIKHPQIFDKLNIIGQIILSHVLIGTFILLILNFYLLRKVKI